jgi:hypothetical protein
MMSDYLRETIGIRTSLIFKDSDIDLTSHMSIKSKDAPKLLRCWGENYPCVNSDIKMERRWLPVVMPAKSGQCS